MQRTDPLRCPLTSILLRPVKKDCAIPEMTLVLFIIRKANRFYTSLCRHLTALEQQKSNQKYEVALLGGKFRDLMTLDDGKPIHLNSHMFKTTYARLLFW
jgi:hypothetical protein